MKLNLKIYILLIISVLSCNSYKKNIIKIGNQNDAIENAIYDFSNTEKGEVNKVYKIRIDNESSDLYKFVVRNEINVYTYKRIKIGDKVSGFPSRFIEVKNRLYVWEDSTQILNKDIFEKLQKYKVLDSTIYKIQNKELPQNKTPLIMTDESKKYLNYFFCKKDISKFKKIKTSKYLSVSDYPFVNCK